MPVGNLLITILWHDYRFEMTGNIIHGLVTASKSPLAAIKVPQRTFPGKIEFFLDMI